MGKGVARIVLPRKVFKAVVSHTSPLRVIIGAQNASPAPPLGSQLGQRSINISAFCKDFNERTKHIVPGVPLPCRVTVKSDRSYELVIHHPTASYLLMQAAGLNRGAFDGRVETAGKLTRKHIYEIARLKSEDPPLQEVELQEICAMVVEQATRMGIKVCDHIDEKEYATFLEERLVFIANKRAELDAEREAKMLKTKVQV